MIPFHIYLVKWHAVLNFFLSGPKVFACFFIEFCVTIPRFVSIALKPQIRYKEKIKHQGVWVFGIEL